jgi:c-di-GMP-binding flagellar brake protein YcgR
LKPPSILRARGDGRGEEVDPTSMDSSAEIIRGPEVKETLQNLIRSGQMCKMEISRTPYCWLTLLSEVKEEKKGILLLVDRVRDFEKVLSASHRQEVLIEYLENDEVPCSFLSRVSQVDTRGIWVEIPEKIQREQKRKFFRLRAPVGTEIFFPGDPGKEEKGTVKDYSLGGVAFLINKEVSLKAGDQLKNLRLCIPEGREVLKVSVPLAVVIRAEPDFFQGQTSCALEFLEFPEANKKEFTRHIFEKQRNLLRRVIK